MFKMDAKTRQYQFMEGFAGQSKEFGSYSNPLSFKHACTQNIFTELACV